MVSVETETAEVVTGLKLTLTPDQGEALVEYLDLMDEGARLFRIANPFLYSLQSGIERALA